MSQVMHHSIGTDATCGHCSDAAYEPGWYAVLRGPNVALSHSCSGAEDPTETTYDVDETPARGLFRRHRVTA